MTSYLGNKSIKIVCFRVIRVFPIEILLIHRPQNDVIGQPVRVSPMPYVVQIAIHVWLLVAVDVSGEGRQGPSRALIMVRSD